MEEIRKDIYGYEGYYKVSNMGNVKSIGRNVYHLYKGKKICKYRRGKQLKIGYRGTKIKYKAVNLSKNGVLRRFATHRLVAIAFIKKNHNLKLEVAHIDGNPLNNFVGNLKRATHKENMDDQLLHKTRLSGEKTKQCKYKDDFVLDILRYAKQKNYHIKTLKGKSEIIKDIQNNFDMRRKYIASILNCTARKNLHKRVFC